MKMRVRYTVPLDVSVEVDVPDSLEPYEAEEAADEEAHKLMEQFANQYFRGPDGVSVDAGFPADIEAYEFEQVGTERLDAQP